MKAALVQVGRVRVSDPKIISQLIVAVQVGHKNIRGFLLAHGSNVHDRDHRGPLLAAAHRGHIDIVGFLLAAMYMILSLSPRAKPSTLLQCKAIMLQWDPSTHKTMEDSHH